MLRQSKKRYLGLILFVAFFAGPSYAGGICSGDLKCLDQGWGDKERNIWYTTSQGSRLLPLSWALALEEAGRDTKFFGNENMSALRYIPSPVTENNPYGLPIGFVKDSEESSDADLMCETFPESCNGFLMRKPWVGMTCSACHTNEIEYSGKRIRIEGAPTLADFQTLLETLLAALTETVQVSEKFDRFARAVLGTDLSVGTRAQLRAQLNEQIVWQKRLVDKNQPGMRYGYGRLDAQGHILNKVAVVGGEGPNDGNVVSDAPASYPHIWNTSQQDKVQWNGIARNILEISLFNKSTDIGALVRNTSEVIGVFAHIEISPKWKSSLIGYKSSVRVKNMIDLERQLGTLKSPKWPEDVLPPIDWSKADRGREHFVEYCSECHADLAWDDLQTPITAKMETLENLGTDIFLACNTLVHQSKAGRYEGRRPFIIKGDKISAEDYTRDMLTNAAVGSVIGKSDELAGSLFGDVFDEADSWAMVLRETGEDLEYLPGVDNQSKKDLAALCLESDEAKKDPDDSIVAYKARPLNGIWSTAPYLHNGSVPSLYELLLPSPLRVKISREEKMEAPGDGHRVSSFAVGNREFDPERVGFDVKPKDLVTRSDGIVVSTFTFNVYDNKGTPIPGNYNSGHEYGVNDLTNEERWELIEYLKTL